MYYDNGAYSDKQVINTIHHVAVNCYSDLVANLGLRLFVGTNLEIVHLGGTHFNELK